MSKEAEKKEISTGTKIGYFVVSFIVFTAVNVATRAYFNANSHYKLTTQSMGTPKVETLGENIPYPKRMEREYLDTTFEGDRIFVISSEKDYKDGGYFVWWEDEKKNPYEVAKGVKVSNTMLYTKFDCNGRFKPIGVAAILENGKEIPPMPANKEQSKWMSVTPDGEPTIMEAMQEYVCQR